MCSPDAFVIVTPDINRSYPASIKSAIDWHFTQWQHKAIGFVGYSGQVAACSSPSRGRLRAPEGPAAAATGVLDQLHWWSTALLAQRLSTVAA